MGSVILDQIKVSEIYHLLKAPAEKHGNDLHGILHYNNNTFFTI